MSESKTMHTWCVVLFCGSILVGCNDNATRNDQPFQSTEQTTETSEPKDAFEEGPASPEQALRSFLIAMATSDREALANTSLPHEELDLLLQGETLTEEQIKSMRTHFAQTPIESLTVGDTFMLPGNRPITMDETFVNATRKQLVLADMPTPFTVVLTDDQWRVDPGGLIAARKAAQRAREQLSE